MISRSPLFRFILGAGIFALAALYGSAALLLPKPLTESASPEDFSAERAMSHVRALAQTPRLVGSPEMERTAGYLVEVLRSYGLDPEVQEILSDAGTLRNVVVRLPGQDSSRALLILSHPDTAPLSPGAGDNASGVAVLLEVARALQAGAPTRNDIILLFDDGEEAGYLGGYAFARSHPWMKAVQYVIGLDTAAWGPVILLQTTPENSDLINAYAQAVSNPSAFGFFADADWNLISDDSEIQPFYEQGLPGLALEDPTAFAGKHSNQDRIEFVKPGSLQQMGEQTLALARYFGSLEPARLLHSDQSYFTLWKMGVVHYPASWNIALVLLSTLCLAILIIRDISRKTTSFRSLMLSFLFFFLATCAAMVFGFLAGILFAGIFPNTNSNVGSYLHPASLSFFLGSILILTLAFFVFRGKIVKAYDTQAVSLAGMLIWLLLSATSVVLLPVGSTVFTIPLSAGVLARFLPDRASLLKMIPAVLATILFIPNVDLIFLGSGLDGFVLVTIFVILNAESWAFYEVGSQAVLTMN